MIVTHYGKQFFKIQLGDTVIAYNPIGKDSKNKTSRFGADIVLLMGRSSVRTGIKNLLLSMGQGNTRLGGYLSKGSVLRRHIKVKRK